MVASTPPDADAAVAPRAAPGRIRIERAKVGAMRGVITAWLSGLERRDGSVAREPDRQGWSAPGVGNPGPARVRRGMMAAWYADD